MNLKRRIQLKDRSELKRSRFLKQGAPWVFAGELNEDLIHLRKESEPGELVELVAANGETIAYGFFNPHSVIAFRSLDRGKLPAPDQLRALIYKRLDTAWRRRVLAYGASQAKCSRLCFGESDGLPGMIIDLFEGHHQERTVGVASIQCHSAGADQLILWVQEWLEQRLGIACGLIRNDLDVRKKEHAPLYVKPWGVLPSDIFAREGGLRFYFDFIGGQKTGFFYDHRDHRLALAQRIQNGSAFSLWDQTEGARLTALDCFSYVGAWGIAMAKADPRFHVSCVDVSKHALQYVLRNAEENGVKNQIEIIEANVLKDDQLLRGRQFDVVVSDPPSMSASSKDVRDSLDAHDLCFSQALSWLKPQGLIVFAACSYHLKWEEFLDLCQRVGQKRNRQLVLSHFGHQSHDHPVLASLPESHYLKVVFGETFDSFKGVSFPK